ncbi:MAG: phosphatidylserine/phosphatidylglycerophosphate/cardiolipin synthase family protein [Acidobacteriota bacterium]
MKAKGKIPRRFRHRLAPKTRRHMYGRLGAWRRVRRLVWSWWPWAIAGVIAVIAHRPVWASLAAMFGMIAALVMPEEAPPRYGLEHDFDVDSDVFLTTIVGATGARFLPGNDIRILNNGREFYPAMLEAIAGARASVTIEAYIYWAGDIGRQFAGALADKARDGVPVKILLDAVGAAAIGEDILETLESGGCQLAWYNPVRWYTVGRYNHRTHRKSLIVDGALGFTGGAGIADLWQGNAEGPGHWRDIQIRLEGPGVGPLQTGFSRNWLQSTGELVSGEAYYPSRSPGRGLSALTLMSSPEVGASTVRTMYYLSIACARRSIDIANPYFVPDEVALEALVEAARRGVAVRVMVSGIHNDNWLARQNSVRLYGALLEAGVELLEFNRTMLHQKTMVIDGVWVTIGTTNFDNRSFAHNEESNVCVFDRALAQRMEALFTIDLDGCDRVTLAQWRARGLFVKASEILASFLEAQV